MAQTVHIHILDQVSKQKYTVYVPAAYAPAGMPDYYTRFDVPPIQCVSEDEEIRTRVCTLQICTAIANGIPVKFHKPTDVLEICGNAELYLKYLERSAKPTAEISTHKEIMQQAIVKLQGLKRRYVRHNVHPIQMDEKSLQISSLTEVLSNIQQVR